MQLIAQLIMESQTTASLDAQRIALQQLDHWLHKRLYIRSLTCRRATAKADVQSHHDQPRRRHHQGMGGSRMSNVGWWQYNNLQSSILGPIMETMLYVSPLLKVLTFFDHNMVCTL